MLCMLTAHASADDTVRSVFDELADESQRTNVRADGFVLGIDAGSTFLTATSDGSTRSLTFQYGFHAGYRFNDWTLLLRAEHATWRAPELGANAWQHAANVGVGFERFYVSAFLRTQLVVGVSILLRSNDLDDAPQTGIFIDFRPLGIHWEFRERWGLVVDLLHIAFVAPVLTGVPLADVQFRSGLSIEHTF